MSSIKKISIAASFAVLALGLAFSLKAYGMDESNWPTQITFDEQLRVGNLSLDAGTYKLYLTSGPVTRNVIMIYSVDKGRWEGMVMGINDQRMDTSTGSGFTFVDRKDGSGKMLEYWFYPGWKRGIKFVYPEPGMNSMHAALVSFDK
jgi:hypothetical protein